MKNILSLLFAIANTAILVILMIVVDNPSYSRLTLFEMLNMRAFELVCVAGAIAGFVRVFKPQSHKIWKFLFVLPYIYIFILIGATYLYA